MRSYLLTLIFVVCVQNIVAQKFYTDKGLTKFDGSKAAFEPIKANNNKTVSILDSDSGQIAAVILISEFDFRLNYKCIKDTCRINKSGSTNNNYRNFINFKNIKKEKKK